MNETNEREQEKVDSGDGDASVNVVPAESPRPIAFPTLKRMITTLDKFLNRRIAGIGMIYLGAMMACGVAIFINGVTASANSGQVVNSTSRADVWLYSLIAVFTFIFALVLIRVAAVQLAKRKKS